MSTGTGYPYGTPTSGIGNPYAGTAFTPLDNTKTIRDNYSSVDKASLTNSLGYAIAMIQNFVNATLLGRSGCYIGDGYISKGHFSGVYIGNPPYPSFQDCQLGVYKSGGDTIISALQDGGFNISIYFGQPSYGQKAWIRYNDIDTSLSLNSINYNTVRVDTSAASINSVDNSVIAGADGIILSGNVTVPSGMIVTLTDGNPVAPKTNTITNEQMTIQFSPSTDVNIYSQTSKDGVVVYSETPSATQWINLAASNFSMSGITPVATGKVDFTIDGITSDSAGTYTISSSELTLSAVDTLFLNSAYDIKLNGGGEGQIMVTYESGVYMDGGLTRSGIWMKHLPTSKPIGAGRLWNSGGYLCIV